eukprot:m.182822 g.182822  ORF g.182822 m.182822 type:complete len:292 (+) comp32135_c1_seq1:491-1366(+)
MGKKKGSKKGGKKKSGKKKEVGGGEVVRAGPTQLELALRLELQTLERELDVAKRDTEEARLQNEFLHEEVERTQEQNHEYEAYIEKKSDSEKMVVDVMADNHRREIEAIESERTHLHLDAERVKKELRDKISVREEELAATLNEIDNMSDIQKKRDDQEEEISQLEKEIELRQKQHFEELQGLKSAFLNDKLDFQQDAREQVQTLELQAEQEAVSCLMKHAVQIKSENRRLRSKLLSLMSTNKQLGKDEADIVNKNAELRRQIELNAQLVRIGKSKPTPTTITTTTPTPMT